MVKRAALSSGGWQGRVWGKVSVRRKWTELRGVQREAGRAGIPAQVLASVNPDLPLNISVSLFITKDNKTVS